MEKSGIPIAAIISIKDLKRLALMEMERERDFAILHEIGGAFADIPSEELESEVSRALTAVRHKARKQHRSAAT